MENSKNIERFEQLMATVKRPGMDKLMAFISKSAHALSLTAVDSMQHGKMHPD